MVLPRLINVFLLQEGDEEKNQIDLQNLFSIGQYVPAVVKTLSSTKHGYKKVLLSVNPEDINSKLISANINSNMVSIH